MGTIAGTSGYNVALCTALSSGEPSGTVVYFHAETLKFLDKNEDKYTVGGNNIITQYSADKFSTGVELGTVTITAKVEADVAAEVWVIRNYLRTYGSKTGCAKTYCLVHWLAVSSSAWINLTWSSAFAAQKYIYGKPMMMEIEMGKGLIATAPKFVFRQVTI